MAISSTSNIDEYCVQYVYPMGQDASDQVMQVSGEAVKFVSCYFTGPVAFHSATMTLEDCTLCGPLRVTDSVVHFQALFPVAIIKSGCLVGRLTCAPADAGHLVTVQPALGGES